MIADLVFFAIIILGGVVGVFIGASRGLLKAIKIVVILSIIFLCSNQVANLIVETQAGQNLTDLIYEKLYRNTEFEKAIYIGSNKIITNGEEISIENLAQNMRIPSTYIGAFMKFLVEGEKISVTLAKVTALNIIKMIFIIAVIFVVGFIFAIITLILRKNKEEKQTITVKDRIFGALIGLVIGLLLTFLVIIVLYMLREFSALEPTVLYLDNETIIIKRLVDTPLFKKILVG